MYWPNTINDLSTENVYDDKITCRIKYEIDTAMKRVKNGKSILLRKSLKPLYGFQIAKEKII